MSPPLETNSQNRELNFLKQTISALREQLEHSLDLHDSEIQSLEENHNNRESVLQSVITQLDPTMKRRNKTMTCNDWKVHLPKSELT